MAELLVADPAADRDEWLALRRQGVTATDIGTILGLTSWDSPWALYHRKKGLLPEVEQSDRMRLGSWLENSIVDHWSDEARFSGDVLLGTGLWRSSERSWQLATPDATVTAWDDSKRIVAVLECKTSSTRDGWGAGKEYAPPPHTHITAHGEVSCHVADCDVFTIQSDAQNAVPAHVRAQVLWQMDVLGVATGHVAVVFLPSGEFRSYTIEHNHEVGYQCPQCGPDFRGGTSHARTHHTWPPDESDPCQVCADQSFMRGRGLYFYRRLRGELPPPPLDGSQATLDGLRQLHAGRVDGKEVEVPPAVAVAWLNACDDYDFAKDRKAEAAAKVRDAMGEGHYGLWRGVRFARRDVFTKAAYTVAEHDEDRLVRIKTEAWDEIGS